MSASEVAAAIRERQLSPVEVAESSLKTVGELNSDVNAFCTIDEIAVLQAATAAERDVLKRRPLGPLHGVPVGVKDLLFTRGLRTTGGSPAYSTFVPCEDDVCVQRLRAAGAIVLGKTNVPTFGFGPATTNSLFGETRNPWNLTRSPGGSSGGSAAAVASGMCPVAVGTDGGGSIRLPSSFCGVFGLKPTFGAVPLYPSCRDSRFPGFSGWETLEHAGPISRTVGDARLVLEAIAGQDRRDRHSLPGRDQYRRENRWQRHKPKIGWTLSLGAHSRVDQSVRAAFQNGVNVFQDLGATVEPCDDVFPDFRDSFATIVALEADLSSLRALECEVPGALNERIVGIAETARAYEDVARAHRERQDLYRFVTSVFEKHDLLLTPTVPVAPPPLEMLIPERIAELPNNDPACLSWYTYLFNATGHPAASVICGWTEDQLPIGLQIIGPRLSDDAVLEAADRFQDATDHHLKRPTLRRALEDGASGGPNA
jgi:aspartyl-tRNA(Asn)/glutamyl-tRNA(Gln) amidotransferase subunit A